MGSAPRGTNYLGVDASLTGLGLVCCPADWDGDFSRIQRETLGVTLPKHPTARDEIRRMLDLSMDVRRFAIQHGATHAAIESVPTQRAFNIGKLGELRGFIRSELARHCHIFADLVQQSSARKLLLGRLPKADRKAAVMAAMGLLTDRFETDDEVDAFVTVNHRMSLEIGVHVIALPAPEAVKKPRKRAA